MLQQNSYSSTCLALFLLMETLYDNSVYFCPVQMILFTIKGKKHSSCIDVL